MHLPKAGENYPLYPGRTDAVGWLEKHWGTYLKYFNPDLDRDFLYQDQLRKLDVGLYQALKGQIYIHKENIKFRDIVPPKKERLNKDIESMSMEAIEKADRTEAALRMRRIRKEKTR